LVKKNNSKIIVLKSSIDEDEALVYKSKMFDEKIWKRDDPRVQSERVEFALTNNSKSKDDKNEEANNVVMRALRAQVDV
jgi:hypothetical protein